MSPMAKLPLTMEHALLGLLARRPMHAYEMYQTLQEARALGLVWHLKQSQLYALLARLEEAGYLTGTTEPQGTRPPRRVLDLTAAGRETFAQWISTPVAHGRDFRQDFLAKLFFAHEDEPCTAAALIERQRQECAVWIADLRRQCNAVDAERPYDMLVLQFRISQIDAIMHWLDACDTALSAPAVR